MKTNSIMRPEPVIFSLLLVLGLLIFNIVSLETMTAIGLCVVVAWVIAWLMKEFPLFDDDEEESTTDGYHIPRN